MQFTYLDHIDQIHISLQEERGESSDEDRTRIKWKGDENLTIAPPRSTTEMNRTHTHTLITRNRRTVTTLTQQKHTHTHTRDHNTISQAQKPQLIWAALAHSKHSRN